MQLMVRSIVAKLCLRFGYKGSRKAQTEFGVPDMSWLDWYVHWCQRAHNWLDMIQEQRNWITKCQENGWPMSDSEETLQTMIDGYTFCINHAERNLVRP